MTPNIFLASLLTIGYFHGTRSATYSNVIVRSGPEVLPIEYVNYGGPVYSGQIAQISAAPLETVVSLPNVGPCISPCVIANSPISGLAPIRAAANSQIVAYKSPVANVPIVLANTDDAVGYQYAYSVYDEGTGDNKAQSEQSDGSVVQGQYSFIQPDGLRREVIYTADDLKGFKAIVKTVAPEPELKKEQLVEAPKSEEKPTEASEESTEVVESLEPVNTEATEAVEVKTEEIQAKSEEKSDETSVEVIPVVPIETVKEDVETNAIVSYSDIIDCIQSKRIAAAKSISPLTYILIPAIENVKRPC
ncbi:unnamed protein product [Leptosia nina]|uniref:Uncharacterized protein n=1 Tax=Leptosia nina TaxID=320188 RepID=A0AAV1K044_9NEOP